MLTVETIPSIQNAEKNLTNPKVIPMKFYG